jgi:hypothetical protein
VVVVAGWGLLKFNPPSRSSSVALVGGSKCMRCNAQNSLHINKPSQRLSVFTAILRRLQRSKTAFAARASGTLQNKALYSNGGGVKSDEFAVGSGGQSSTGNAGGPDVHPRSPGVHSRHRIWRRCTRRRRRQLATCSCVFLDQVARVSRSTKYRLP